VKAADGEVKRVAGELAAAKRALAALGPQLPSLVSVDAWRLARLRPLLAAHPGALFVSYHLTEKTLIIWALERGALRMQRVQVTRRALEQAVGRYRERLGRFHPVDDLAQQLHRWLLAPVLPAGGAKRLVVVPAGPLHVLPFAALHDGRDHVVARSAVTTLPSLNALRFLPAARPAGGRRVALGWAGTGERPLSFTVREAAAVGEALPGTLVLGGAEATRARLLKEAAGAELLHVASHGRFDEEAPLLSALELADGELPLVQVLGLKLKAELVILSSCESGLGQLDGADGVLGLQAAFLLAGARRVIASLWRVSDLGSALLMKHVARRLAKGEPPEAALRGGQLEVRRRYPHPAFWAGFRLDGAP